MNIYSTTIFEQIVENDPQTALTPEVGTVLVGIANLVGVMLAPIVGSYLGMRTIFIGGQLMMGCFLACVAIFAS